MDLDALRFGRFETLGTAVTDWAKVVGHLQKLEKDARDGLKGAAEKADWKGVNATVTREFITKTAGEFADAHAEAKSIHNILKDTHDELVGYRNQLNLAISEGLKKNLTVLDTGNGSFTVTMNIHPDRAAAGTSVPDHSQQDVDHFRDEIQRILKAATESDNSADQALRALVDQAEYGFSGASYQDRDSAAKAMKEAERLAGLLRKKGDSMSPEEFDELNRSLAKYRDDPLFQEKFATTLGPRGTLDFWADLSDPSDGGDLQRSRHEQFGELQKNLGLTLAGATRSDSPEMRRWEEQMVRLGDERIQTRGAQVYGFQLMSNLMRVGDYDDRFLDKYGNALVATEKKMRLPDRYWNAGVPPMPKMNFIGDDFGRDPMTGLMTGLSHSPRAATDFFTTTQPQDNAAWVLKERPVFDDTPLDEDDGNPFREATGKALLAAATGVNPGDPNAVPVEHTADHRRVLDRSLKYLSEAGDEMPSEFRDDMATVLVNWGDEVHHTTSSLADDPGDPRQLDRRQLLEVTKQVSRDQNAYGILNDGLNREMVRDIYHDHPGDPKETLLRAGHTVGFLEEARYQALKTDKDDPSWDAKWLYHGFGGAVNFIPVVGDAAQRGVDALAYNWQLDEQERIDKEIARQNEQVFRGRENQLQKLADLWADANPGHHGNTRYTLTSEINTAALNGNGRAQGLAGDQ
ncbi:MULTISPECIES: DUF6571 family protein [Streptomyces]|uniref:DUF6571 family protein n=1 Tax=Streptomyces TaxID=1883 RepID=UPI00073DC6A1|nr:MULTISPECIES: DUF6571 family protein [unclassified Streptomyces]OYP13206.1 hypothetical protein CFC35_00710 [Streptomyces sp. FBKL.4005]BCM64861.1 hypothetical protein EASAB2608_00195 [Streptomyces sp. EAS-AB2608]CUW32778.1 hypothetical protein TUE45_pSRTUE45c_0146 [Streptomyces reticuli]